MAPLFVPQEDQRELREAVGHIKGKVDMLNDWHLHVNEELVAIKSDQKWILRIAIGMGALALLDKAGPSLGPALSLISKFLGG